MGLGWSSLGDTPAHFQDYMSGGLDNLPETVGDPDQVGRVWIARSGKGPPSPGHLSVLVAVDGRCIFPKGRNDVPTTFYGVQYHIGLRRDEKGRITRYTELLKESWHPGGHKGQKFQPRPFIVAGRAELFPLLDKEGAYAKITNPNNQNPLNWAVSLGKFALSVYSSLDAEPRVEDVKEEEWLEANANMELGGEGKFVNTQFDDPLSLRWDSTVNCHSFAVRFVEALSLTWPEDLTHSGEYGKWLVDTALAVHYARLAIKERY